MTISFPPTPSPLPSKSSEVMMNTDKGSVYDLIGIGFGPANLALSIALRESQEEGNGVKYTFVEKQSDFAWHSSLLLPGSQLQVSPLKDLATMRDPTSSYTFYNYLHQKGRLAAYINREANVPSRREWSAYLAWAAKRMDNVVTYNQEVISVEADQINGLGRVRLLRVTTRDLSTGQTLVRLTKNITVGVGGVARLPESFNGHYHPYQAGKAEQVVHSSTYLPSLAALEPILRRREAQRMSRLLSASSSHSLHSSSPRLAPLRFAVLGSGQSSAEITLHLHKTFPNSQVKMIFRSSAITPSDDSPFVNSAAFDPNRTDIFWQSNEISRLEWIEEFKRTNYSVVRSDVLNELHTALYDQEIELDQPWPNADGPPPPPSIEIQGKLQLSPNTVVDTVKIVNESNEGEGEGEEETNEMIQLSMSNMKSINRQVQVEEFDAVFLGTGFQRQPNVIKFLEPIKHFFPLLDSESSKRKAELGFGDEVESDQVMRQLIESGDEVAVERLRHRTRGIGRDYRLISYWSDAFKHPSDHTAAAAAAAAAATPRSEGAEVERSGSSSPRSSSATSLSTLSSSETLGDDNDEQNATNQGGNVFEPSIFFLGGNERTHGLSDSLLSIVAHRSGELCETIMKSRKTSNQSQDIINPSLGEVGVSNQPPSAASLSKIPIETLEEKVQTLRVV